MKRGEIILNSLSELDQFAQQIIQLIPTPGLVCLYGEMGTGKTTLISSICKHLGVHESEINSPTFSIVNEYLLSSEKRPVYHIDLYRLDNLEEAVEIGIEDIIDQQEWCFIEWPELLEPLLPENINKIYLQLVDSNKRKLIYLLN